MYLDADIVQACRISSTRFPDIPAIAFAFARADAAARPISPRRGQDAVLLGAGRGKPGVTAMTSPRHRDMRRYDNRFRFPMPCLDAFLAWMCWIAAAP